MMMLRVVQVISRMSGVSTFALGLRGGGQVAQSATVRGRRVGGFSERRRVFAGCFLFFSVNDYTIDNTVSTYDE